MNAKELFQAGKLTEAVQAVSAELRENPTDLKRRTFLFELLCFAGEYDRADKQLDILAQEGGNAEMGTLVYRGALHAERTRQELFKSKDYPKPLGQAETPLPGTGGSAGPTGTLNGKPFEFLEDADPRVGPRLEVFAAGSYLWIPFEHVASLEIAPPRRLRDLLWIPAILKTGPALRDKDLGEILLPALSPFSWKHPDDAVRLGRATVWDTEDGMEIPAGQKMLLVDEEELPFLEVRHLEFYAVEKAP